MLYHAILQLNQKAKQTAKQKRLPNTTQQKLMVGAKLSNKKTKKAKAQIISQAAFNKQNTVDRRNDFKRFATPK